MRSLQIPRRFHVFVLALLLGAAACATTDGGVGGTGIATVRGNVLDPDLQPLAPPQNADGGAASAAGITVSVRNADVRDVTDEAGTFHLEGFIAGEITLDFAREDRPVTATMRVLVPVESEVIIDNIELLGEVAAPEVIRVENLAGDIVGEASCDDEGGSFVLRDRGGMDLTILLTPETKILHSTGASLSCADLSENSGTTKVRGSQRDLQIVADEVQVARRGSIIPGLER
jgi:hypothetical protein